ncbi:MAG: M20 family metallopeptidase [Actinomycetales bacterium]|nr:M20 family metallopeptidase [Actinomycetales bacterium]
MSRRCAGRGVATIRSGPRPGTAARTGRSPWVGTGCRCPPKVTVTSINGGASGAFSVVPDRCEVEVDVRLTPDFDADAARALLRRTLAEVDKAAPLPSAAPSSRSPSPGHHLCRPSHVPPGIVEPAGADEHPRRRRAT